MSRRSDDNEDPVAVTKGKLRRSRKRRRLQQAVLDGIVPLEHHDVLIIPPADVLKPDEIFRVPVVKDHGVVNQGEIDEGEAEVGTYVDKPERHDAYDYAQRRVMSISRPQDWGSRDGRDIARGPAFGTLPVKREPAATSCASCYLINAQRLNYRNAWTAEEWTDIGGIDLPPAPSADDDYFETLIAGPRGMVFHLEVQLKDVTWQPDERLEFSDKQQLGAITQVDLRYEMEIWNQLRNGTLFGRVLRRKSQTPVPLVNITALLEDQQSTADTKPVAAKPRKPATKTKSKTVNTKGSGKKEKKS